MNVVFWVLAVLGLFIGIGAIVSIAGGMFRVVEVIGLLVAAAMIYPAASRRVRG